MKISIKKRDKVVDRWYSFSPNSFKIQGVGKVLKVSHKKQTALIEFDNKEIIQYDFAHINEFVKKHQKGMKSKFTNKIIPK